MITFAMMQFTFGFFACQLLQTSGTIQYANIDEETGCPLNLDHVCKICAKEQGRWGCYCELDDGSGVVTSNLFSPCPAVIEDPCSNHSCQNGATCLRDGLTGYKCQCLPNYGGDRCEQPLLRCDHTNIQCPNGICVETKSPILPVFCQCYDGTRRDPRKNETCPLNPCYEKDTGRMICENNSTCEVIDNRPVCNCKPGWSGRYCSKALKAPHCHDRPGVCGEGVCVQSLTPPFYSCRCGNYSSIFGKTIDELIKCEDSGCYAANPCQNGGTCSNKGKGAFLCQCPRKFTGLKCEKHSVCYNNPCRNNGVCQPFNESVFFCHCPANFTGSRCELEIPDPCKTKVCGPFGLCKSIGGLAFCQCDDGLHFNDLPCQDPCRNRTCDPGVCTRRALAPYEALCSCPIDRKGDFCQLPNDLCRNNSLCGGGYCKLDVSFPRGYACVCEYGRVQADPCPFTKNCPIKNCGERGICVETDGIILPHAKTRPIYYVCLCEHGYISSGNCDHLILKLLPLAASRCGRRGIPYPSLNLNNPIGCWCKNGTHIEEIDPHGPQIYCS